MRVNVIHKARRGGRCLVLLLDTPCASEPEIRREIKFDLFEKFGMKMNCRLQVTHGQGQGKARKIRQPDEQVAA